jgi:cob(I)alamin adenosyltransferase
MTIYTGTGDRGRTSLYSGERVPKSHARIEAVGALDELNAALGALRAFLPAAAAGEDPELERIQSQLFVVGARLAVTPGAEAGEPLPPLSPGLTRELEEAIDRMEAALPPLTGFILPAGDGAAALAHVARTVCRRAERRVVGLLEGLEAGAARAPLEGAVAFLNRLSDYLFVLARHVNRLQGRTERLWKP